MSTIKSNLVFIDTIKSNIENLEPGLFEDDTDYEDYEDYKYEPKRKTRPRKMILKPKRKRIVVPGWRKKKDHPNFKLKIMVNYSIRLWTSATLPKKYWILIRKEFHKHCGEKMNKVGLMKKFNSMTHFITAVDDTGLMGFAWLQDEPSHKSIKVFLLCSARKQGRSIMERVDRYAIENKRELVHLKSLEKPIGFYKLLGFEHKTNACDIQEKAKKKGTDRHGYRMSKCLIHC